MSACKKPRLMDYPLCGTENKFLQGFSKPTINLENPFLGRSLTENRILRQVRKPTRPRLTSINSKNVAPEEPKPTDSKVFEAEDVKETPTLSNVPEVRFEEREEIPSDDETNDDDFTEYPEFEVTKPPESYPESFISEKKEGIKDKKFEMIQICATALLSKSKLDDSQDPTRVAIIKLADEILLHGEAEFILKLCLYLRRELNIRSTTLLLLAYLSLKPECSRKAYPLYFKACIRTPSEWVTVADFVLTFLRSKSGNLKPGSLPVLLRKAMNRKFSEFDEYQLAKHRMKGRSRKKKNVLKFVEDEEDEDSVDLKNRVYNVKRLIRLIHIKSPSKFVLGLLEKKYPENEAEFRQNKYEGIFDPKLVGKRMKLSTPLTWETQISKYGNKPKVWHFLTTTNKLPYLATIRNLRNMVKSGMNESQANDVRNTIIKEHLIFRSKIFPHQLLLAYGSLKSMDKERHLVKNQDNEKINDEKAKNRKIRQDLVSQLFQKSLEEAIEICVSKNIPSLCGNNVIFIIEEPMVDEEEYKNSKLASHPSIRQNTSISILAGLMLQRASEVCKVFFCGKDRFRRIGKQGKHSSILDEVDSVDLAVNCNPPEDLQDCKNYLRSRLHKEWTDNVIFIFYKPPSEKILEDMEKFMEYYRSATGNKSMVFASVFIVGGNNIPHSKNPLNMNVTGFTGQTFESISRISSHKSQLNEVENIHKKYKIPDFSVSQIQKVPRPLKVNEWIRIKIFVSSTFMDMFGERDLLNYCVFPELRRRCRSISVEITPLDLRWGLPQEDSVKNCITKFCLDRVQQADVFICFLGERYGWKPDFSPAIRDEFFYDNADLSEDYEKHLVSVTEMEIRLRNWRRAHFYFRDINALKNIPSQTIRDKYFTTPDEEDLLRLNKLKEDIRNSGSALYENYRALSSKAMKDSEVFSMSNFEDEFVKAVIDKLWEEVQEIKLEKQTSENEDAMESFIAKETSNFIGRENDLNKMLEEVITEEKGSRVMEVQGYGVTSFLCKLTSLLRSKDKVSVIPYFSDASPEGVFMMEYLQAQLMELNRGQEADDFQMPSDDKYSFVKVSNLISRIEDQGRIIVIVIDEGPTDNVSWIPSSPLPACLRIIVSSKMNDSLLSHHLRARRKVYDSDILIKIPLIRELNNRRDILRSFLLRMGDKVLNESRFQNALRVLSTKRDSGDPRYMRAACSVLISSGALFTEEERVFVKNRISPTYKQLLRDVVEQEDKESSLLIPVITIITECDGISIDLLNRALQYVCKTSVSPMSVLRLLNRLEGLLDHKTTGLIIKRDSDNSILGSYSYESYRTPLLKFFLKEFNEQAQSSSFVDPAVLRSLSFLGISLGKTEVFRNLKFLYQCFKSGPSLIESIYFRLIRSGIDDEEFIEFIRIYSSDLVLNPLLTFQCAKNFNLVQSFNGVLVEDKGLYDKDSFLILEVWNTNSNDKRSLVGRCFNSAISCSASKDYAWAHGSGESILIEERKGGPLFGLVEKSVVVCLSFITSGIIGVGCDDGSVSFWDLKKRSIIVRHLQTHIKPVTRVLTVPLSRNVVSVGLDGHIKIYSTANKFVVSNTIKHKSPISCGFPDSDTSLVVGTWKGEICRVNLSSNAIVKTAQISQEAFRDIVISCNDLLACSDVFGHIYILNRSLQVLRMKKISHFENVVYGNRLSFNTENEVGIGCSDGSVRTWNLKVFRSNFYQRKQKDLYQRVVSSKFVNGSYEYPSFEKDLVVCSDFLDDISIVGYDSGWVRIIFEKKAVVISKILENNGEMSQVLIFKDNFLLVVTRTHHIYGFRIDTDTYEFCDHRIIPPKDGTKYLPFVVPMSKEKSTFLRIKEDGHVDFFRAPQISLNKKKSRKNGGNINCTLYPFRTETLFHEEDKEERTIVTATFENGLLALSYDDYIHIWKYSEKSNEFEKLGEVLMFEDVLNICFLKNVEGQLFVTSKASQYIFRKVEVNMKDLDEDPTITNCVNVSHNINEHFLSIREGFYSQLNEEEFYDAVCSSKKLYFYRGGRSVNFGEKHTILTQHRIKPKKIKGRDVGIDEEIHAIHGKQPVLFLNEQLEFCTEKFVGCRASFEPMNLSKYPISSILRINGEDDRHWVIAYGPTIDYCEATSTSLNFIRRYKIEESMELNIEKVWSEDGNTSIFIDCMINGEIFTMELMLNGAVHLKKPRKDTVLSLHNNINAPIKEGVIDERLISCSCSMNDNAKIFGSLDGRLVIQINEQHFLYNAHSSAVMDVIQIDSASFFSISKDRYLKVWKIDKPSNIRQIGEFHADAPLTKGGFSHYAKCILIGGDFGLFYALKLKNFSLSI